MLSVHRREVEVHNLLGRGELRNPLALIFQIAPLFIFEAADKQVSIVHAVVRAVTQRILHAERRVVAHTQNVIGTEQGDAVIRINLHVVVVLVFDVILFDFDGRKANTCEDVGGHLRSDKPCGNVKTL